MTPEELDAIEARCNAATPEPWDFEHTIGRDTQWFDVTIQGEDLLSAETEPSESAIHPSGIEALCGRVRQHIADIEFVAHARQDVPLLVAEVRRLRANLARATEKAGVNLNERMDL